MTPVSSVLRIGVYDWHFCQSGDGGAIRYASQSALPRGAETEVRVIAERIDTILLVTGVLTRLAVVGFLFPDALLRNFFSEECRSANVLLMVRHWSLLVFLVGGQLVYAAYQPAVRSAGACRCDRGETRHRRAGRGEPG